MVIPPCSVRKISVYLSKGVYMSPITEHAMSRIDVRLPLATREIIDRAAAMQGRSRTDFLMDAVLEKAKAVIAEHNLVQLSLQDQTLLATALIEQTVSEPSDHTKALAQEYSTRVQVEQAQEEQDKRVCL